MHLACFIRRMITMFILISCTPVMAQSTLSVQVMEVSSRQVDEKITLSGEVNALLASRLSLETDGLVKSLFVDVGSRVEKGDPLLKLDEDLTRESFNEAQAGVVAAQATFNDAQRLYDEAERLLDEKHIAQSELQTRQSRRDETASMLQQAKARRDFQYAVLKKHTLYAPFAGVITQKNVEVGEWHQTGSQVLQLVSVDEVRLDVRVPQEVYPRLRNVRRVTLRPDTSPNETIDGEIATLVPVGTSSGRSFLVRLKPTSSHAQLIPGTSARATIAFEVSQRAMIVPRDALLRQPDGNVSAFVVEDGVATRRLLTLGGSGDYGIEVVKGLSEGERVVVRGNEVLSDGQSVRVKQNELGRQSQ